MTTKINSATFDDEFRKHVKKNDFNEIVKLLQSDGIENFYSDVGSSLYITAAMEKDIETIKFLQKLPGNGLGDSPHWGFNLNQTWGTIASLAFRNEDTFKEIMKCNISILNKIQICKTALKAEHILDEGPDKDHAKKITNILLSDKGFMIDTNDYPEERAKLLAFHKEARGIEYSPSLYLKNRDEPAPAVRFSSPKRN